MTVRITKTDEKPKSDSVILRVEGKLHLEDARLVEQAFDELQRDINRPVDINLSELTFLDSESASVLMNLQKRGANLTGLDIFTRQVIELAELPARTEEENL